jgi:hypothetical protein
MTEQGEAEKFDAVVRKMLTVPREELKKRERAWQKRQARKRAKTSTAKRSATQDS